MVFDFNFYRDELQGSESSRNYQAVYNKNGIPFAFGAYQFIQSTINWIAGILGQQTPTVDEFLKNPALQDQYFDTYVQQSLKYIQDHGLDSYIGQTITGKGNGITAQINIYGLVAGAHLGGNGGLQSFLLNGVDASDHSNPSTGGTYISDYIAKFSEIAEKKKTKFNSNTNNNLVAIENLIDQMQVHINSINKLYKEINDIRHGKDTRIKN